MRVFGADNIVVLTGAGISAESGIKTFRAVDGFWEDHDITAVASPEGFVADPELVNRFYNQRRRQLLSPEIKPNSAHEALVKLERLHPGAVCLVTQNIDDLHERAGSVCLIHMHGELLKQRCDRCQAVSETRGDIFVDEVCCACGRVGTMRPHVVWFGEMPHELERIYATLARCALFISVGTSGNVYPAAGFVELANSAGAHTVELNLEPSAGETEFAEKRYGPATRLVPQYVDEILALR
ncbi:MAG: NAD-dependent protein deacylase [Gammaproteobacteria bacterium]|nr:NAD-dependent protein deacylase [Gammaproteobacteria bacterium]